MDWEAVAPGLLSLGRQISRQIQSKALSPVLRLLGLPSTASRDKK